MKIFKTIKISDPKYVDSEKYGTSVLTWAQDEIQILHACMFAEEKDMYVKVTVQRKGFVEEICNLPLSFFMDNKPFAAKTKTGNVFYSRKIDQAFILLSP